MNMITAAFIQEAVTLLNSSGYTQFSDVKEVDLVGETAVVRPIHIGQFTISYLIGERDVGQPIKQELFNDLAKKLRKHFNDEELQTLCFALTIPYEDLGSQTHSGRAVALVQYAQRHGRLADLVAYGRQQRSHVVWPDIPDSQSARLKTKTDLAVVVSINNMALQLAADFLKDNQIDCNYLLLTTTPDYSKPKWLPEDEKWDSAAQDFYQTMQEAPKARRHFFIAAPMPYAFAIGCVWGLVNDGDELYHWDGKQYVHVMTTSRQWKN